MYLLTKFGGRRSFGNVDITCYINSSEKTKHTALISYIERFSKSAIPIYNFEVPYTAGRKTTKRRKKTQTNAKCYTFHPNAIVIGAGVATSTSALL